MHFSDHHFVHNLTTYHAKGKFLLSAEYFVLDGALALALPLQYGQVMKVKSIEGSNSIQWRSYTNEKRIWFEAVFDLNSLSIIKKENEKTAASLQNIFRSIKKQNAQIFEKGCGYEIETHLDFPREWGLGTSSTLIHLLAHWSHTSAYGLLKDSFGGSGYDLACAGADGPIFYKITTNEIDVQPAIFIPEFKDQLYFVYLGKKQNSREGIAHYRRLKEDKSDLIKRLSEISRELTTAKTLKEFDKLILEHETIVGNALQLMRAKELYFSDYTGEVKSLGAWGGDFVLVTSKDSEEKTREYFNEKGFDVFFKYEEMVYKSEDRREN